MKYLVHYRLRGQPQTTPIDAANSGAAAVIFRHHHPNCTPDRIVAQEERKPVLKLAPPVVTITEDDRPMTSEDYQQIPSVFAQIRARLAAVNAPVSRPGRVDTPSLEDRHGPKRK